MRSVLLLIALCGLAACSSSSATGSSGASPTTPSDPAPPNAAGGPALGADGKRFAAETRYQGECVGGRGGCYALTFHPDGRAEHLLLDATETGTYRIDGNAVIYNSTLPEAQDQRFESTDGFRTLGKDYRYAP
ncbi:MAG: hypothetical protein ABI134_24980 [Byssovorax sp.]